MPEAELSQIAYTQIGPISDSFVYIRGGGDEVCDWNDFDTDNDGIPDCKEGGG